MELLWGGDEVPPLNKGTWDQWNHYGVEMKYPLSGKDVGPVEELWDGDGITPSPPVWTDTHLWKQYLLHPSDAGGNGTGTGNGTCICLGPVPVQCEWAIKWKNTLQDHCEPIIFYNIKYSTKSDNT